MTARSVANYFLRIAQEEDFMTNMKLQKLVYYAQGFSLVILGRPLFEEPLEAWMHGPVVPSLYHELKEHKSNPVPASDIDLDSYAEEEKELLNEVYEVYGQFTAMALRAMTHRESPWMDTSQGSEISHDKMREYFETQVN